MVFWGKKKKNRLSLDNWNMGLVILIRNILGLPCWLSGKESTCQCRRHRFNPWSRKIPHAAEQLSPCTTTTEPGCRTWELQPLSPRVTTTESRVPWSPCSTTRKATAVRSLPICQCSCETCPSLQSCSQTWFEYYKNRTGTDTQTRKESDTGSYFRKRNTNGL